MVDISNFRGETISMNKKLVEEYILRVYKPKKNRSVEKNLLLSGHYWCVGGILTWLIGSFLFFDVTNNLNHILYSSMFLLLMIPLVVWLTLKACADAIKDMHKKTYDSKISNAKIKLISVTSATAGVGGWFAARAFLPHISDNQAILLLHFGAGFLCLVFIFCAVANYYRIYLIRKYCPHLKERKE